MGWNHHLYPVTKLFNHPQRKFCVYSKTIPHFPQPQPLQTTNLLSSSVGFSSVQSLGCVQLFATPWTAAHQGIYHSTYSIWTSLLEVQRAFLVTQRVQNLLAMQGTWVQFLGWEDSLKKKMATHSSILAWEIHGQRNLAGYSSWDCKELDMTEGLTLSTLTNTPYR